MFTRFLSFSLLLVGLSAFGQAFTPMRPFVRSTAAWSCDDIIPGDCPDYWWVASDVPAGQSISNQWVDRINGLAWEQPNASYRPVSTSSGIYFDASRWLTNTGFSPGSAPGTLFLFVFQTLANPNALLMMDVDTIQQGWDLDNRAQFHGKVMGNPVAGLAPLSTVLYEVVCNSVDIYTNGVLNKLNSGVGWSVSMNFRYLGCNAQKNSCTYKFNGYINEIAVWYDVDRPISAGTLASIHQYVTNHYTIGSHVDAP